MSRNTLTTENVSAPEMVFQMLSRKCYTTEYIAGFCGVCNEDVEQIALVRAEEIEANHKEWLECKESVDRILENRDVSGAEYGKARLFVAMWGGRRPYRTFAKVRN